MKILRGHPLVVIALIILSQTQVHAESLIEKYAKLIPDNVVRASLAEALKKVHLQPCEGNKPCAVATAKDVDHPPITIEDGRAAMAHGITSALAQWCGLDPKRSFLPMIAYGRHKLKMSDRPLMIMTLMHTDFQIRQLAVYKKQGTCPPKFRIHLDTLLPKL